ncbi:MAG: MFS transporter [Bryobacterales bacterium]|nr:MFS transporter [Bryobacterales bacterium]
MQTAASAPVTPVRITPDPERVRAAMTGLLLLGAVIGFVGAMLPVWAGRLSLDLLDAGRGLAALGAGSLVAALAARKSGWDQGPRLRKLFAAGALLCGASLFCLPLATNPNVLALQLAGLGVGGGAVSAAAAGLLRSATTGRRISALLNLAGVSFGLGAVVSSASVWWLVDLVSWQTLARVCAVGPAILAVLNWRARAFDLAAAAPPQETDWRKALTPAAALLALSLILQALNYGVMGGWLALYSFRKLGATAPASLAVLFSFWLALTAGRVAATRLPAVLSRLGALAGVSATSVLGCIFLLNTSQPSGALVGAMMVGAGLGALHPLTMSASARRSGRGPAAFVPGFFVTTFLGGVLLAGLLGPIAGRFGVDVIVWTSLAGSVAAMLVLSVIALESKLSEAAAAR